MFCYPSYPNCRGNHNTRSGIETIIKSAIIKTNRKGITSLIISPNGILDTALITNNKTP